MSKWAALVYGRTYEVDFRFLSIPANFTADDRAWAERHILGATRTPERLVDGPRWLLFQDERHSVVGVACMARDLIGRQEPGPDDVTRDEKGRPLYLFVGYVAQGFAARPSYSSNLRQFQPLIEVVRARWREKSYEVEPNPHSAYEPVGIIAPIAGSSADLELNFDLGQVVLWPVERQEMLWQAAALCEQPVSLCLAVKNQQDAMASPFLNCTVPGVDERIIIPRITVPSPTDTPPRQAVQSDSSRSQASSRQRESRSDSPRRQASSRQRESRSDSPRRQASSRQREGRSDSPRSTPSPWPRILEPSPLKIRCGVIGGAVGLILGGGLNPVGISTGVIGFGVGWVVGGLIEDGGETRPPDGDRATRQGGPSSPKPSPRATNSRRPVSGNDRNDRTEAGSNGVGYGLKAKDAASKEESEANWF